MMGACKKYLSCLKMVPNCSVPVVLPSPTACVCAEEAVFRVNESYNFESLLEDACRYFEEDPLLFELVNKEGAMWEHEAGSNLPAPMPAPRSTAVLWWSWPAVCCGEHGRPCEGFTCMWQLAPTLNHPTGVRQSLANVDNQYGQVFLKCRRPAFPKLRWCPTLDRPPGFVAGSRSRKRSP